MGSGGAAPEEVPRERARRCVVTNARRLALLALLVVMTASGWYVFVYLYRWEWNRALVSGVLFIAAEIALLGAVVLDRMSKLGRRVDGIDRAAAEDRVLRRLQETAPGPTKPFQ